MRNTSNFNNAPTRYRSKGSLKMDVYVTHQGKGMVQFHYGQDDAPGPAEESQGGIYTLPAKVFNAHYAMAR